MFPMFSRQIPVALLLVGLSGCSGAASSPDNADADTDAGRAAAGPVTGATEATGAARPGGAGRGVGVEDGGGAAEDAGAEDAGPDPALVVAGLALPEGGSGTSPLTFTVTLSAPAAREITVDYATADGTATARADAVFGADYTATSGKLTFRPGDVTKSVSVTVLGDRWREGEETFSLVLSNASGASIGTASATATIVDDDVAPAVAIDDATVIEGDAGTTSARFALTLSAPTAMPVTVRYRTIGGAAIGDEDFDGIPEATATFAPGETAQAITVAVHGDTTVEPNETFTVELSSPVNATLGRAKATGTIQNDDGTAVPTLSIAAKTVPEGSAGRWVATVPVRLSAPTAARVTVDYASRDGTAVSTAGGDFEAVSGTLTFEPGDVQKDVLVPIVGDVIYELDQTFSVRLLAAQGANIAVSDAVVTVANDDPVPTVSIADARVLEGQGGTTTALDFVLTLSAPSEQTISLHYATADGTARAREGDYDGPALGPVSFAPMQTTLVIEMDVFGDDLDEDDETFTLTIASPEGATLGAKTTATGTIVNDDAPPYLYFEAMRIPEGSDVHTVNATVRLSAEPTRLVPVTSGRPVQVKLAPLDAAATSPSDYAATSGTLRFEPGEKEKTIPITVNGDAVTEPDEVFFLVLSEPSNARLVDGHLGVTLLNDDAAPPILTLADGEVIEGDLGSVSLGFHVYLDRPLTALTPLRFTTEDGNATGGLDYRSMSWEEPWPEGTTDGVVSIPVLGDSIYEFPESFYLVVSSPSSGVVIARGRAAGTIVDNDPAPRISAHDVVVTEGTGGGGRASVSVTLDRASAVPLSVHFETVPGTALPTGDPLTGGADYIPRTGTLTFAPGETEKTIELHVNADSVEEPDESFTVALSTPSDGAIDRAVATVRIANDDHVVVAAVADARVLEGTRIGGFTLLEFVITLSGTSSAPITLDVQTMGGTATASIDFLYAWDLVVVPAGEVVHTFVVSVVPDDQREPDETMSLVVAVRGQGPQVVATGTIVNDDQPTR